MKQYLMFKHQLKSTEDAKDPSVGEISELVAAKIERIWIKASIPTISHTRVLQMLRAYHDKYRKLLKPLNNVRRMKNTRSRCGVSERTVKIGYLTLLLPSVSLLRVIVN